MTLNHQGQNLVLLDGHAIHLPNESALLLADVHLGKASTFQHYGIAVPEGDNQRDLDRISRLVERTGASKVIVAGDLIHSSQGALPDLAKLMSKWLDGLSAELVLVVGNHDTKALTMLDGLMTVQSSLDLGSIHIVHDSAKESDATGSHLTVCGHLHPVVAVRDGQGPQMRCPCFWLGGSVLTLPAFGTFTGGQVIEAGEGDRVFITLKERVVEIPHDYLAKRGSRR